MTSAGKDEVVTHAFVVHDELIARTHIAQPSGFIPMSQVSHASSPVFFFKIHSLSSSYSLFLTLTKIDPRLV